MGLLDDLEKEAERRREEDAAEEAQDFEQRRRYKRVTEPRAEAMQAYLEKLTDNLNYIKPDITLTYMLPSYGEVQAKLLPEWSIEVNPARWRREIVVLNYAQIDRDSSQEVTITGAKQVKLLAQKLQSMHLAGNARGNKDAEGIVRRASFRVSGKIPLTATISVDINSKFANMKFDNFGEFASRSRSVPVAELDDEAFDRLGRFLAFESDELMHEQLDDDIRAQLRRKVEQDRMERKWAHQLVTDGPEVDDQPEKRRSGLFKKFEDPGPSATESEKGPKSWLKRFRK